MGSVFYKKWQRKGYLQLVKEHERKFKKYLETI